MTNLVEITDQAGTSGTVVVDRDRVAETIRPWFIEAPADVLAAIDELQGALDTDDYAQHELAQFLGLGIFGFAGEEPSA